MQLLHVDIQVNSQQNELQEDGHGTVSIAVVHRHDQVVAWCLSRLVEWYIASDFVVVRIAFLIVLFFLLVISICGLITLFFLLVISRCGLIVSVRILRLAILRTLLLEPSFVDPVFNLIRLSWL